MSLPADFPAASTEQLNGEFSKAQEKITIRVRKCTGLEAKHGSKTSILTTVVRIEFGNTLLGESPKCDNDSVNAATVYDFECSLNVVVADLMVQDDLVQTPLVVTVIEIQPKDKKTKEEKANAIAQTCIDLLPLVQGKLTIDGNYVLHPTSVSSDSPAVIDQTQPEVELSLSVDEPLFSEEQLNSSNLMRICFESLYSLPESWNQTTAAQYMYLMALPLPVSPQKEIPVIVPNGIYRSPGDKEQRNQRRWCMVPTASGASLFMPNSNVLKTSYQEEDGHFRDTEDVLFRSEAENDKSRVTWNVERRCFLTNSTAESFMKSIAKQRFWPVEITRTIASQATKGKGKGDDDILTSFHGIAYVDMAPLLYPGVQKIRGAYPIEPFSESDLSERTGRKGTLIDEAAKMVSTARSSSSIVHSKVPVGKTGKAEGKLKPSASVMKPPDSVPDTEVHETKKTEGQQYVDARSYIVIEFQLEAPLVAKREPDLLEKRISELIPPRPKFSKREGGAKKAVADFQTQIGISANQMLEEFRKEFSSEFNNVDGDGVERRQREFLYHLNASGKYFALKEQLKYFVVKIVREKYKNTSNFADRYELQSFLSELYEFLLNQMHLGLNNYLLTEETPEIPVAVKDTEMLKFFAFEAEALFDFERAAKYYQEILTLQKNQPEYWVDYGCLCLLIGDTNKAAECFKEAVAIDQKNLAGLIMNGYIAVLQDQLEVAEVMFETATYCENDNIIAWTILGLYYAGIDNNILAERAFNEATRLNSSDLAPSKTGLLPGHEDVAERPVGLDMTEKSSTINDYEELNSNEAAGQPASQKEIPTKSTLLSAKKIDGVSESIFLQAARFLLAHKAIKFAEKALSHELLAAGRGESASYFQALAELQMHKKEYEKAQQSIENCLKLEHLNADAWCLSGHLHFLTGQGSMAKNAYERSLAYCDDAKDIHTLYLRLCAIYLTEKEYSKAKEIYLKACEKNPSCVAWLGAGISSYKLGEHHEAECALNEANILDNHNSEVWAYLTLVCLKQKRHLEAEQCYRFSIKTGLDDAALIGEIQQTMESTGFDLTLI